MNNQKEEFVKVILELPDPSEGVGAERMWAIALGNDVYEIRNSPWFARNVNWGDWVKAIAPDNDKWPVFVSVVKRSGHRTIHFFLHEVGLERKDSILREINRLGAHYENCNGTMYAVDCQPEIDITPIIEYLNRLEAEDALRFRVNAWD